MAELQGKGGAVDTFEVIAELQRRIKLDAILDVSLTFPQHDSHKLSPQQRNDVQGYVVRRIRELANKMGNYRHNGGSENFNDSRLQVPPDADLVAHVLRYSVENLMQYFRLPHQAPDDMRHELSVCIADNGEPYFWVRLRDTDKNYDERFVTNPGPDSLFHALIIWTAVVARRYGGTFGSGPMKQVDLKALRPPLSDVVVTQGPSGGPWFGAVFGR